MKVNFNPATQAQTQTPSFGVKFCFRAEDIPKYESHLFKDDKLSEKLRAVFAPLVACIEHHNSQKDFHEGVLSGRAVIRKVQMTGTEHDGFFNIEANDTPLKPGSAKFFASEKITPRIVKITKKLFAKINAQICKSRTGSEIEQPVLKNIIPYGDEPMDRVVLLAKIRALSDEHVK